MGIKDVNNLTIHRNHILFFKISLKLIEQAPKVTKWVKISIHAKILYFRRDKRTLHDYTIHDFSCVLYRITVDIITVLQYSFTFTNVLFMCAGTISC